MARKIGQFKRLKKINKYKNLDAYLNSIYRQNKDLIDSRYLTEEDLALATNREKLLKTSKKTAWKNHVKEYMEEGYSVDEALKKVSNSRVMMDYEDLARNNALDGLKEDKEAYKKFRELTKVKGKYTKIDSRKLTYIGNNEYAYENVVISFKNSPEEIIVRKL